MSDKLSAAAQHDIMMKTPIPRLVTRLCIPTVIGQMITVIYSTADTWFVARIGTSAAAASGIVFSVMSIIQAFGFGIGMGTGSIISRQLGEKKDEDADVTASSGFFLSLLLGIAVGAFGLIFLEPLMKLLGSTDTMLPLACDYGKYIFAAAPVMCCTFVFSNILRAEGKTAFAAVALAVGGVLNMILDPLFIFVLDLGIAGASIATALSQFVSFLVLVRAFYKGKSIVKVKFSLISRHAGMYGKIVSTGFPTICRQSFGSISSALLNRGAMPYGDAAVAAITIATKVYVFIRNLVIGIGQGFQPVAGYNYGAGNKQRTKQVFVYSAVSGTVLCALLTVFIYIFPSEIIHLFRSDPVVVEYGAHMLRFFCFAIPVLAYSTFVNQLYQCLGFRAVATLLASCRQGIFFIPLIYILSHFFGLTGVEATQASADVLTFIVSVPCQIYFFKKYLTPEKT